MAEFIPTLAEIINLKIEKAEALAQGEDHYNALIDEYEPNISADEISAMFKNLRPTLVELRKEVLSKEKPRPVTGNFDEKIQLQLANEIAMRLAMT